MKPRRIELPPYSLFERRAGAGTPVALIHGLSGSSRWWLRNLEVLAERHLVAAIDLVGFGSNVRFAGLPQLLPPFEEVSTLLARWLESFGEPVHLVGHSMGGEISIRIAAERPDLVRSLVLVNAAGIPFTIDPAPHVRVLPKPPYGGIGVVRLLVPDFLRAGPTSVAAATLRVLRGDERESMRAIHVPTLLVWGENDPIVPLRYAHAMQAEIAGSRLVVIPGAHVVMWDNAVDFNRVLLEFLDEVERDEGAHPNAHDASRGAFSWGVSGWTSISGHRGIAHRQAGRQRNVVLIHGLGMASAYFVRFARALFDRGWNPIAPDLPGFGESLNAPALDQDGHARVLAEWADVLGIRDAVWIGHSAGCNAVAALARARPDLVRECAMLGPLWGGNSFRLLSMLLLDAFREPAALFRYVLPSYWRTGVARWLRTWRAYARDSASDAPDVPLFAGERDPIPNRAAMPALVHVPGAHACHFSHPEECAEAILARLSPAR